MTNSRWFRGAGLLVGLVLLVLAIMTTVVNARAQSAQALDYALESAAAEQSATINEYFERARSVVLLTSYNPAFTDHFEQPTGRLTRAQAADRQQTLNEINGALLRLNELYPDRIGEACFIDANGVEVARVTHNEIAPQDDLSTEEAAAPFFAPTMALRPGQVYQAEPYVSPDTHEWVIANSTPLAGPDGNIRSLVHFEITVDSFREQANRHANRFDIAIVNAKNGEVVVDSRHPLTIGSVLGDPANTSFRSLPTMGDAGFITTGDRRSSFRHLDHGGNNANDWYVVVSAPKSNAGLLTGFGAAPLAMMAAALLLLGFVISSVRSYQRALRHSATHDALTGLPNRSVISAHLERALSEQADGRSAAVMIIDLDDFKNVNDTLGHYHGDLLLQQAATRLSAIVGPDVTVGRLGGDEFAVVMPSISSAADAVQVAELALQTLLDNYLLEEIIVACEASIGIAIGPDHGQDADSLLRCADVAMYQAKAAKKGHNVYNPNEVLDAPTSLAMLGELRHAIDNDELVLHFQPKMKLETQRLSGVEALVRWEHPERGLIPPMEFIELAERTALISKLTVRVLDLALLQIRTWLDRGQVIPVAVNVSARSLSDLDFPSLVLGLLAEHRVPAGLLRLEITESAIMQDPERATQVLGRLHAAGIPLSVDDFGTGHSSMMYLKQLPVDELKIDRAFVKNMTTDRSDAILVRSAIELGHNLNLTVVAEGIEDNATLQALRTLGCDSAQGYFLARPMPVTKLDEWMSDKYVPTVPPSERGGRNRFGARAQELQAPAPVNEA